MLPFSCYSVKIAPGAVVCVESEIRGDVTIGKKIVYLLFFKNWCDLIYFSALQLDTVFHVYFTDVLVLLTKQCIFSYVFKISEGIQCDGGCV